MRDGGENKCRKRIVGRKEVVVRVRTGKYTIDMKNDVFGEHITMDNNW